MPLYLLKSNRRGEDGREYLVLLRCIALQKFYFANVSTVFASQFLVIHHLSIFLIDILYKKSPKPRSKIMVNCNIYYAIQCTNRRWILVSLPIFLHTAITVRLYSDWICKLLIRFSAGVKVSKYSFSSLTWKQKKKI